MYVTADSTVSAVCMYVCHLPLSIKALANEDSCCGHKCFPVCPGAQHLLRTQILCPGHKKCF